MTMLYGVTSHVTKYVKDEKETPMGVFLSTSLKTEIRKLPHDASIAIEYSPGLGETGYEDFYWNEIIIEAGIRPLIFLESPAYVKELAQKGAASYKALETLLRSGRKVTQELRDKSYRASVEYEYFQHVYRTANILDIIKSSKPEVVIVEEDCATRIYSDMPELFGAIKFEEPITNPFRTEFLASELISKELDTMYLAGRDSYARQFNAVTNGRVVARRNPDFIGSWDPKVPARGLFEIYIADIDGNSILGEIEDVNGPASFSGVLTPYKIEFGKKYSGMFSALNRSPHLYRGAANSSGYEGAYYYGKQKGKFKLSRYKPQELRLSGSKIQPRQEI